MLALPDEILSGPARGFAGIRWSSAISEGLAAAQTAADEVHALVAPLSARDQWFVLGGWSYFHSAAPSQQELIDALPPALRVSRQRVAQIVGRHEQRLAESSFRPNILNQAVQVLAEEGGTLPTQRWLACLHEAGIAASSGAIRTLPALGTLGVTDSVRYDPFTRLWSSRQPNQDSDPSNITWAKEVRRIARSALRRDGAIPSSNLEPLARYGLDHAMELVLGGKRGWDVVAGYIVPRSLGDTALSRLAKKMLAVSSPLRVSSIVRGLARPTGYAARLPEEVVRAVLAQNRSFQVRSDRVRLRHKAPRTNLLTPLENAFVDLVESRGGIITASGVSEWLGTRGTTVGFTGHLCRAPFVRRLGRGLYALRGRRLPAGVRERRSGSSTEPLAMIGAPEWPDESTCIVRYRADALRRAGGLWLPSDLAFAVALGNTHWRCSLEGYGTKPVQLLGRNLVGMDGKLPQIENKIDLIIEAVFDLDSSHVELRALQ